jgi:hypothetical protein
MELPLCWAMKLRTWWLIILRTTGELKRPSIAECPVPIFSAAIYAAKQDMPEMAIS